MDCKNSLYDEEPGLLITDDLGMQKRTRAETLKINYTNIDYYNMYRITEARDTQMKNLKIFGNSKLGDILFNSDSVFLASRYIEASSSGVTFGLRGLSVGSLYGYRLCDTNGNDFLQQNKGFHVIVSVPASHINVADDGTVTLK